MAGKPIRLVKHSDLKILVSVFNPTPYRRLSLVISCPEGELLGWLELITQTIENVLKFAYRSASPCYSLPLSQGNV